MQFADVPGHEATKAALLAAAQTGRMPHALLFRGGAGVGKLPLAWALAQYLNCQQPTATDSCGTCASCRKSAGMVHPDVHWVAPIFLQTGKSTTTDDHIEGLRALLTEQPYTSLRHWGDGLAADNRQLTIAIHEIRHLKHKLGLRAYEGGYKVVVLWHAEKVNTEAGNAFLKLLEEPPDKTVLLLTLEEPAQLLPTLTSRCQQVPVGRLPVDVIEAALAKAGEPAERAHELAFLSEGSLGHALAAATEGEGSLFAAYQQWLRWAYEGKLRNLVPWSETLGRDTKEAQKQFLEFALARLREVLALCTGGGAVVRVPTEYRTFLERMAPTLDPAAVERMYRALDQAALYVQRNANGPLTLLNLSLEVHGAFRAARARAQAA